MGIFDSLGNIVSKVDSATSSVEHTINTAERAKQVGDRVKGGAEGVGKAFQKKCKYCKAPLSSDAEKRKGMCAGCALERAK